jgi:glycosyltransferase involved in cell wall biosynthesis
MGKEKISAVINTLDEEKNIRSCLESVRWCDEIVVVDMYSDDRTVEIARTLGARVYLHERILAFDGARTFAIAQATNDWILILDADEEIPAKMASLIRAWVDEGRYDVIELPRANFAFSGFAPHESGFPEYHRRLFRRTAMEIASYQGRIHTFYEVKAGARVGRLPAAFPHQCILHYTNPTVSAFINKINQYTTIEASQRFESYNRPGRFLLMTILRPLNAFWVHYLRRRGFLDGWRGFWLSIIFVIYEWLALAKIWEMKLHGGRLPTVEEASERMRSLVQKEREEKGKGAG